MSASACDVPGDWGRAVRASVIEAPGASSISATPAPPSTGSLINRFRSLLDARDDCQRAVQGGGGDRATFSAACIAWRLVPVCDEAESDVWTLMRWYNRERCDPPWDEDDPDSLTAKITSAQKSVSRNGELGTLSGTGQADLAVDAAPVGAASSPRLSLTNVTPLLAEYMEKVDREAARRQADEGWLTYVRTNSTSSGRSPVNGP